MTDPLGSIVGIRFCPLRTDAHGAMQQCVAACGWRIGVSECAVALLASSLRDLRDTMNELGDGLASASMTMEELTAQLQERHQLRAREALVVMESPEGEGP